MANFRPNPCSFIPHHANGRTLPVFLCELNKGYRRYLARMEVGAHVRTTITTGIFAVIRKNPLSRFPWPLKKIQEKIC